ncbi:hypothetical protein [Mesobacterium pallidum]|uniref:hypothetical protein n=1 Tax=Mesobacterium pallidum TaxID=2872037 RepID=UPI001EE1F290|nr:hypothetical protein [Mesobacterium pallidum]
MKRIATLIALVPASAMAHGAHAPVPAVAHNTVHVLPLLGLAVIVAAAALAWLGRVRE